MRTATLLACCLYLPLLAGCPTGNEVTHDPRAIAEHAADGVSLRIELPGRTFSVGEQVPVTVTATNLSDRDVEIIASSGALVFLRIYRETLRGREEVLRYPRASIMLIQPWVLPAGRSETFKLNLTVGPDWPSGELLWMSAELNGRMGPAPTVSFDVRPQANG